MRHPLQTRRFSAPRREALRLRGGPAVGPQRPHDRCRFIQTSFAGEPTAPNPDRRHLLYAARAQTVCGGVQCDVTLRVVCGGEAVGGVDAGGGSRLGEDLGIVQIEAATEAESARREREASTRADLRGPACRSQSRRAVGREPVRPDQREPELERAPFGLGPERLNATVAIAAA